MSTFSRAFRARAMWLHERGDPGWIAEGTSTADVERRLRRWEHLVAGTRPERFARRLAWDGWTDRVPAMLSPGGQAGGTGDPHWFQLLERIVSADLPAVPLRSDGGGDPVRSPINDRLPFEEVFARALRIARTSLNDRIPPSVAARAELSPSVWARFERHLSIELANLCADSLFEEFSRFRPAGYALLARMNVPPPAVPERVWYERFIASLEADHLAGYFERHPVLGRLYAVTVGAWIDSTAEFVQRLAEDRARIAEMVTAEVGPAPGRHLGPLVDVTPGLSDRHHGGRSVMALEFACGRRVVYKPRPLAMEAAWQRVLAWCNRSGLPAELGVAGVCDRGSHGWMTFVDHEPCSDEGAVDRFYLRVGEMLCLLHVLRATDCHWENLVAAGEHPVLIDAETLLHPDISPLEGEMTPSGSADDRCRHSVLRTGLLPRWEFDPALRRAVDVGGLTGGAPGDLRQTPDWVAVNTDHMVRGLRRWPVRPRHLPTLGGRTIDSADFVETVVAGFNAMYALVQRRAPELLRAGSVIEEFRGKPTRFILRVTQLYQDVLSRALVKTSDAVEAGIEIDALARAFVRSSQRPSIWPALAAEHRALLQLDTPYFAATTDALDLCFDGGRVPSFFARTGMDDVLATVRALDDDDRRLQSGFIRAAFHARAARADGDSGHRAGTPFHAGEPLTREEALAAAEAIARDIAQRAIRAGDGSVNWIGLSEIERAGCYQLAPLGTRLYDGVCGIALFLTALDACSGNDACRELTDAALHPLRRLIRDGGDRARQASDALPIGAATGLGSLAYALSLIAHLRRDADLLDDAVRLAGWIDGRRIAEDKHFDVLGGAAGAALALLAVYGLVGDPGLLHHATLCGEHLLANRSGPDGQRAWRTHDGPPLAGFSHGAAGIACALARLAAVTGDERFTGAAREALAFERTLFSAGPRNWADARADRPSRLDAWYQVAWCHGAAGIALGRLGMLAGIEEPAVRDDLEAALETTAGAGLREVDHLCCGNAGRGDVLLEAGIRLGRPGLCDQASLGAAAIVRRARRQGGYTIFPDVADRVISVGFFQGTAGIGYHVLRLHHAALLPSVLEFASNPTSRR